MESGSKNGGPIDPQRGRRRAGDGHHREETQLIREHLPSWLRRSTVLVPLSATGG